MKDPIESIETCLKDLFHLHFSEDTLYKAATYAVFSNGKRLRPRLTLAVVEALQGDLKKALIPACALELIHTYSLIHDDLPCMDNDDFRRGQPTVHKQFDEATALLAGDFLLTYAFQVLAEAPHLSDLQKIQLIQSLSKNAGGEGMIGGQVLDLQAANHLISIEHLQLIHQKKTGALLSSAIEFGGIISTADEEIRENLKSFGLELGLAYQIVDDVIDVTASHVKHGKTVSSDVANGKNTYVSFLGIEQAKKVATDLLNRALERIIHFPKPESLKKIAYSLVERNY